MKEKRGEDRGLSEVDHRGIGKVEHQMKWKSWCSGRSCERDPKGKEFIEDKRK